MQINVERFWLIDQIQRPHVRRILWMISQLWHRSRFRFRHKAGLLQIFLCYLPIPASCSRQSISSRSSFKSGAPNDNFWKISVRKTIWDLEFSKFFLLNFVLVCMSSDFRTMVNKSGAPNEKIVQNPCNIAFLNVF